jgi:hypothetical protein
MLEMLPVVYDPAEGEAIENYNEVISLGSRLASAMALGSFPDACFTPIVERSGLLAEGLAAYVLR